MAALNGAVHFRVRDYINTGRLKVCPFVLSFDLSDEVFYMIALPKSKLREELEFDIFGFRGSLSVVCYEPSHRSKLFTVDLCGVIKRVIGFRKNGHIFVVAKLGLGDDLNLSSYDPESQQLKNKELGTSGWPSSFCADNYVENLVLLDKPVLFDKANGALSQWVVSRKRKSRVESEDERVRDKETIRKLKKAMVDQQEERVRDKETICKLKKAMVHQQEAMTHQQEEIATLKIEITSLKSQMATLKSQSLLVQQWSNLVENTSSGVGDVGS